MKPIIQLEAAVRELKSQDRKLTKLHIAQIRKAIGALDAIAVHAEKLEASCLLLDKDGGIDVVQEPVLEPEIELPEDLDLGGGNG